MRFARVPPVSKPVARAKRKGDEFYQTKISIKKVPVNFPKSYISGITKVSGFEWYASLVLSPPTPSKLYDAGDSFAARLRSSAESPRGFQYGELTSGLFPGQTSRT